MPPSTPQPYKSPVGITFALIFAAAVLLIMLSAITFLLIGSFHAPNSGQHTGYVTSVEQSGFRWKTWTVYIKTDPRSSQEDTYCVIDPTVIAELQSAATAKNPVTVYYSISAVTWKWQCNGEQSIIRSVVPTATSTGINNS